MVSRVLDASAFYSGLPFTSETTSYTTPQILDEIQHIKGKYDMTQVLIDTGRLKIAEADEQDIKIVKEIARQTNDITKLSKQDISILALCKNLNGELITDDFAISNVAKTMKINVIPVMTEGIKYVGKWIYYCPRCKENFKGVTKCERCGGVLNRKLLKR